MFNLFWDEERKQLNSEIARLEAGTKELQEANEKSKKEKDE